MKRLIVLAATLGLLIGGGTVAAPQIFGYTGYTGDIPSIPCKIANVSTTCDIDTGNGVAGIIVGSKLAGLLHLHLRSKGQVSSVYGTATNERGYTTLTALGHTVKVPVTVYPALPIKGNIGPIVLHYLGATLRYNFTTMSYTITALSTSVSNARLTVTRLGPYTDKISWPKQKSAVYAVAIRKGSANAYPKVLMDGKRSTYTVVNTNSVIIGLVTPTKCSVLVEIEPNYNWNRRSLVTLHL